MTERSGVLRPRSALIDGLDIVVVAPPAAVPQLEATGRRGAATNPVRKAVIPMQLSSSIVVPQDIRQVWRFLGDPLTAPSWDRSVAQVVPLSTAPVGVGYEAMTVAPSGKRQRFRITRYDTERELAFVLLDSRLFRRAELSFQLDRVPDGTSILHRIDLDLRTPLLAPVLRLTSRNALGTDMERLRGALARAARA